MTTKDEVRSTVEALSVVDTLKLALEALEWFTAAEPGDEPPINAAITAIRAALASKSEALAHAPTEREQPAEIPQSITCPFCYSQHVPGWMHDYNMDRMKKPTPPPECQTDAEKTAFAFGWWKALEENRKQPAQQQEPVAWMIWTHGPVLVFMSKDEANMEFDRLNHAYPEPTRMLVPLYTSPPIEATPLASQRSVKPWVGLTDEEAIFLIENECLGRGDLVEAIEAKLREKNEPREKNT